MKGNLQDPKKYKTYHDIKFKKLVEKYYRPAIDKIAWKVASGAGKTSEFEDYKKLGRALLGKYYISKIEQYHQRKLENTFNGAIYAGDGQGFSNQVNIKQTVKLIRSKKDIKTKEVDYKLQNPIGPQPGIKITYPDRYKPSVFDKLPVWVIGAIKNDLRDFRRQSYSFDKKVKLIGNENELKRLQVKSKYLSITSICLGRYEQEHKPEALLHLRLRELASTPKEKKALKLLLKWLLGFSDRKPYPKMIDPITEKIRKDFNFSEFITEGEGNKKPKKYPKKITNTFDQLSTIGLNECKRCGEVIKPDKTFCCPECEEKYKSKINAMKKKPGFKEYLET